MKTKYSMRLTVLALAFASYNASFSVLRAQGDLAPPGPPAPAMKTLDQIEPRTPISSVPFVIRQPGAYYLTTNLTAMAGDAIDIATNGVTLDLNGFTITSTLNPANGIAIGMNTGASDITILNGHIVSGVTNNAGVFSGAGFGYGISGPSVSRVRVTGVSVVGCQYYGIYLPGTSAFVDSCTVQTVGSYGILANNVSRCTAYDCGDNAIVAYQTASECYGYCTGNGSGVYSGGGANNCYGYSRGTGDGIYADNAINCFGESGSSGDGILATSGINCDGESDGGYGLYVTSGQNSYGYSTTSYGIDATSANNCYGYSSYSDGIYAFIATGCYGESLDTGYGLYAVEIATGCYGYSVSGTGLSAPIGESCSGTSLIITHNLNSY